MRRSARLINIAMIAERPLTPHDLLTFYIEAGVDCAIGEEPVNRLAEDDLPVGDPAPAQRKPVPAATELPTSALAGLITAPAKPAVAPPEQAAMAAREAAASAPTLDDLRRLLETFDGCALRFTASRLVFADGNPQARIMLVGEAPGRDEDIEGRPFVGRSGKLLDLMLAAIGLDRTSVYIANIIPWRPPGNRTPTPQETQICLPFIRRQIELVNPDVLVCLGNPSSQGILGTREGIMKTRGRWRDYDAGARTIKAMPTFHPAYLLRSPAYKRLAWQDLREIRRALANESHVVQFNQA
jgi:uracil-DNA glycosylase